MIKKWHNFCKHLTLKKYSTWWHFKQYKLMHNHYFTHISIVHVHVPLLLNRQLYVNMGEDRGGLLLLDGTVSIGKNKSSHQSSMYLVLASNELPVILPEKVDQIDS